MGNAFLEVFRSPADRDFPVRELRRFGEGLPRAAVSCCLMMRMDRGEQRLAKSDAVC